MFVVGDSDSNELHALKRVGAVHKHETSVSLVFFTPEDLGRKIFTLYAMSDSYLGLDQQYEIYLDIISPPLTDGNHGNESTVENDDDEIYISD